MRYSDDYTTMCIRCSRRIIPLLVLAVVLGGCKRGERSGSVAPADTPSVLLITLDTTRADRLGCYGYGAGKTRSIDALAGSGVLFRNAFSQVPLTLASHASLLTGTYPATNGVPVNGVALGGGVATLAEVFRDHGYRTGAFVSALVLDARYGLERGFDEYNDDLGTHEAIERKADRVTDAALDWLGKSSQKPFFAWVHYFDAHSPYVPPAPFREQFDDPYDGEIAFVDSQIGRLVEWLDQRGRREHTLVLIAGDHGEAFGEHHETAHGFFIYNTTVHVPLILSFPGVLKKNTTVETPVGLVDVFPTVVDTLGWERVKGLEGQSLARLCRGEESSHDPVYVESEYPDLGFGWAPLHSIIRDQWKYIDAPRGELFDRLKDPMERTNVIEENASVASELNAELETLMEKMVRRGSSGDASNAGALSDLESLGYVGGAASAVHTRSAGPQRDPKDMVGVYEAHNRAVTALLAGRYAQAIEIAEPLVQASPESDEFYNTLGRAYLETGRIVDAQHAFEMSLRRVPDNPRRLWRLGESLRRQGKFKDAIVVLRAAIAIAPALAEAHSSLGDALSRVGKSDESLREYQAAVAASPDLARAHGRLGVALAKRRRFNEALIHLRRYVELEPRSPHALTNLGNVLFQTRHPDEATTLFKKALSIDPKYAPAHLSLFQVLLVQGKTRERIEALRTAHQAIPQSVELTRRLAWLLATTRRDDLRSPPEALELAQEVIHGRTPTSDDLAVLAAAYAATGDFDAAVQNVRRAISLATARHNAKAVQRFQRHLQRYQSATPYTE